MQSKQSQIKKENPGWQNREGDQLTVGPFLPSLSRAPRTPPTPLALKALQLNSVPEKRPPSPCPEQRNLLSSLVRPLAARLQARKSPETRSMWQGPFSLAARENMRRGARPCKGSMKESPWGPAAPTISPLSITPGAQPGPQRFFHPTPPQHPPTIQPSPLFLGRLSLLSTVTPIIAHPGSCQTPLPGLPSSTFTPTI